MITSRISFASDDFIPSEDDDANNFDCAIEESDFVELQDKPKNKDWISCCQVLWRKNFC